MDINIDNRLYNDFVIWANANGLTSDKDKETYIIQAFRDKFMIDKYGDLNEKIKELKPKAKKDPLPKIQEVQKQEAEIENAEPQSTVTTSEDVEEPIKKTRRTKTLKTK